MYNVHREYYIILTAIFVVILYILYIELFYFRHVEYRYSINNNFTLELVWSILPALITLHFMLMTIALLYISDEHTFFGFQVKVIGHQWYWEYDVAKCFSSVESIYTNLSDAIIPEYGLKYYGFGPKLSWDLGPKDIDYYSVALYKNHLVKNITFIKYDAERLLDTEGVLYTPYHTHVRLLITSMDVIHSFTIPSLGIKADAIPGRLNDLHFFLTDNIAMTHYFGQCSELCGVGHAFMPIHMVSI
jgi:heme/copper-type cytochrome/quinol oxidase subunit 2